MTTIAPTDAPLLSKSNAPPTTSATTSPRKRREAWRRRFRRTGVVALGAGLAAALVYAWAPRPLPVETAATRRGPMVVTVDEAAKTRVKDRFVISAPLGGDVARLDLRVGDRIARGDVLARIVPAQPALLDPRSKAEASARLASAQAQGRHAESTLARARLAAEHAARDLEQVRPLAAAGSLSADALEVAEFETRVRAEELTSARFALDMATHETDMARAALGRFGEGARRQEPFEVPSPVSGRVLRVIQASGGVVPPGTPLLEIGDPTLLEVVADVLTADAVRIHAGSRATLDGWGGPYPLAAHVRLVEPSAFTRLSPLGVEEQRVNVVLDFDEAPTRWSALGDGFRLDAHVVVWENADALMAPASATFRQGDGWATYVVSEGRAHLRPLQVGERALREVQLTAGAQAGERLIVHPSDAVREGTRVKER